VFSRHFQRYITSPIIPKISTSETKEICNRLATAEHDGQKNCNGKTTMFFYKCIEGKLGICLLLAMFIGEDWMVNLMIIYIKKIIAKALDFNNIIKNFMGMLAQ
jgi:hypothetical protein